MCCTFIRIGHTDGIRKDVKEYILLGVGPTSMTPVVWPHFVKYIFSMQSISSLVTRCYVLERTPSNLQGTKANMQ